MKTTAKIRFWALGAALLLGSSAQAQNLVINPSFENTSGLCGGSPPPGVYWVSGGYVANWSAYNSVLLLNGGTIRTNSAACPQLASSMTSNTPYGDVYVNATFSQNFGTVTNQSHVVGRFTNNVLPWGCYQLCFAANGGNVPGLGGATGTSTLQVVVKNSGGAERLAGEFTLSNQQDAWGTYSTTFNIPIGESMLFDQVELRVKPVRDEDRYEGAVFFDNISIAKCGTLDDAATRNATGFIDASIRTQSLPTQSGPGGPIQQNQEYLLEAHSLDNFADQIDCWSLSMSTQQNGPFVEIDHRTGNLPTYSPARGTIHCGMFYKISHSIITGCGRPLCATMVLYASCTEYDDECPNCTYYGTFSDDPGGPFNPPPKRELAPGQQGQPLFEMSPNPAKTMVTVRLPHFDPNGDAVTLTLTDLRGAVLKTLRATDATTAVDLSDVAAGSYLLQVRTGAAVQTQKIVRQ